MKAPPRLIFAILGGLMAGLAGETLLVVQRQCAQAEALLREDLRVVFFLGPDVDEVASKIVEEKLRAMPEVADIRYISKDEALTALRKDDPAVAESATLLGDNPLPPAFEVSLAPGSIGHFPRWVAQAQTLAAWSDVRYKPVQVRALLQARFYSRFLNLALSCILCLAAILGLSSLWPVIHRGGGIIEFVQSGWRPAVVAAAGAALGAAIILLMALPTRASGLSWNWPSPARHAALFGVAALYGWVCGHSHK